MLCELSITITWYNGRRILCVQLWWCMYAVGGGTRDNKCGQLSVQISHKHSCIKKKKPYFILSRQGVYFSSGVWCVNIKSNWRLQEPHNKDSTAITLLIAINNAPSLNIIYKKSKSNFTLPQNLFLQLQLFIFLHIILLIHIITSVMYGGPETYVIFYASEITLWSVDNSVIN